MPMEDAIVGFYILCMTAGFIVPAEFRSSHLGSQTRGLLGPKPSLPIIQRHNFYNRFSSPSLFPFLSSSSDDTRDGTHKLSSALTDESYGRMNSKYYDNIGHKMSRRANNNEYWWNNFNANMKGISSASGRRKVFLADSKSESDHKYEDYSTNNELRSTFPSPVKGAGDFDHRYYTNTDNNNYDNPYDFEGSSSQNTITESDFISELLPAAQRRLSLSNSDTRHKEFVIPFSQEWDAKDVQFTTITVGSLMLFLIIAVMILALRVHCRNREKSAQEWIRHPIVQPSTATSDAVQPNFKQMLTPGQLDSEPIRIKAKGLLERRGSNTSLTIDLGNSSEGGAEASFPPSKECTPEDFLMTAGSRMSRRQLRLCLRDPRDIHAEFWQIPTNHPDKCSVPGAAAKNRYRTVLPNEETRVILKNVPADSIETPASQYVNANYIRGYDGEEKTYIAMQGPLAHTIEDLWLLVMQERCPAVVMITRLKEKGRVKCEPYVPNYSATYGCVQVTVKQVIQKNGYAIRQIFLKKGEDVHTTLHYWFTSWPDHKAPSSARYLLAMAAEVETARKDTPRGPVAVHCSAGIGRTGCFIAISIGIHQLLEENCVDVLSIVCQMRLDRGGMVQTGEQYEFIHRALAFYEASLPSTTTD